MADEKTQEAIKQNPCIECQKLGKTKDQACPHKNADLSGGEDSSNTPNTESTQATRSASSKSTQKTPETTSFKLPKPQPGNVKINEDEYKSQKMTEQELKVFVESQQFWDVQHDPQNNGLIVTPLDQHGKPISPEAFDQWAKNVATAWEDFRKLHAESNPELKNDLFKSELGPNRLTLRTPSHLTKEWEEFMVQKGLLHPGLAKKMDDVRNARPTKEDKAAQSNTAQTAPKNEQPKTDPISQRSTQPTSSLRSPFGTPKLTPPGSNNRG